LIGNPALKLQFHGGKEMCVLLLKSDSICLFDRWICMLLLSCFGCRLLLLLFYFTYLIFVKAVFFVDDNQTCCDPAQVNTLYTNMKIPHEVNYW